MSVLQGREILLGVAGGIAAYKGVEVLRLLKKAGAQVSVVMTPNACRFVAPLTFQTLSGRPVLTDIFNLEDESAINHIRLPERAQAALVAPCTANLAAKLAHGLADDPLSTVLLALQAPLFLAPAMNDAMWNHPATRKNFATLAQRGARIIPPETGFLAEGKEAIGRLAEPAAIVGALEDFFGEGLPPLPLAGKAVLVSAGPTLEPLDPVRYLSNHSSGQMGYAVAAACLELGAQVTLVSGPVGLAPPPGVELVRVQTALQMAQAVLERQPRQNALVLAAAVADYRPTQPSAQKIKRSGVPAMSLELTANPDIAQAAGQAKPAGQLLAIFAAESENLEAHALAKLKAKGADLVFANDVSQAGQGFNSPTNQLLILRATPNGPPEKETTPLMDKTALGLLIARKLAALL